MFRPGVAAPQHLPGSFWGIVAAFINEASLMTPVILHGTVHGYLAHRGTSLIRNSAPSGPYSRTVPRALWWS